MKKIRIVSFLLIGCLLFSNISSYADENVSDNFLYKGDIDSDGSITATDALMVLKHAAKLDEVNTIIADVDEDMTVNATDALYILKYAAKLIAEFPGGNTVKPEDTPEPTETASPGPEETATPEPTETVGPNPTETNSPEPTETATPEPVETASPVPTLSPIDSIKEYVRTNGFDGESGEKIYGYTYEEGTVTAAISYISENEELVFSLKYEEISDVETMLVSVVMEYDNGFDSVILEAGYEYGDFKQNYVAKAPIIPAELTSETKYEFTEVSSENCSDDEKSAILSMGDMYMETALYLWNSVITEDMSVSLVDIGFTSYNSGN